MDKERKRKPKLVRKVNTFAKALANPLFRQRKVPSSKIYTRKLKQKDYNYED